MTNLYRFFDADGRLLYVGITDRGPRRWREHMRDKDWWSDVCRIDLEHQPSRLDALEAEAKAIRTEDPLHNIAGKRTQETPDMPKKRTPPSGHRSDDIDGWDETSLVGSFFHSDAERGWQGQIVAKLTDDTYLAETYEWLVGEPSCQKIVTLDDMAGWRFYDDAEWMRFAYEHGGVQRRWDHDLGRVVCPDCGITSTPEDHNDELCESLSSKVTPF